MEREIIIPVDVGFNKSRAEDGIQSLITLCGGDVVQLAKAPARLVKAMREMTSGYRDDPAVILSTQFPQPETVDQMIVVPGIDFTSICEHHLLPFVGTATVGYIPNGPNVVGLSKIARLVECFAKRFQLQERLTTEIADAMQTYLEPIGTGVIIKAQHQCMSCRGVKQANARMVTSELKGVMKSEPEARQEFLKFM